MKEKAGKPVERSDAEDTNSGGKKPYVTPSLTKYGTVKDVYKGPSCKAILGYTDDK